MRPYLGMSTSPRSVSCRHPQLASLAEGGPATPPYIGKPTLPLAVS